VNTSSTRDRIVPLGHATVLLDLAGVRLITDPVLRRRVAFLERVIPKPEVPEGVDAVLISHLHHDHCDPPSLAALLARAHAGAVVVVPHGAGDFMRRRLRVDAVELGVGDHIDLGPVTVTAVPAEHDGKRGPWGPTAAAVGFVMSVPSEGRAVYFAGDTDLFPEMQNLVPSLDLALLPIWGWGPKLGTGHLDPTRAAEAVARLAPSRVMPIHFGTLLPVGLRHLAVGERTLTRPFAEFLSAIGDRNLPVHIEATAWGQEVLWVP
jgi:L-ascorbate metabolism protein UlaG (beta-lactamase superfamily)